MDNNNIEDLLRALVGDDEDDKDHQDNDEQSRENKNEEQGLFSGLDPEMLIKLMGLLETLNQPDDTERFLLALKPLLRQENRPKIDSALRLIKLFTILPMLRETGLFDKLI